MKISMKDKAVRFRNGLCLFFEREMICLLCRSGKTKSKNGRTKQGSKLKSIFLSTFANREAIPENFKTPAAGQGYSEVVDGRISSNEKG